MSNTGVEAACADSGMTVEHLLDWAKRIGRRAASRSKSREIRDEAEDAAVLGLAEALDSYDPSPREGHERGPMFLPYARRIVHGRAIDAIRYWIAAQPVRPGQSEKLDARWSGPRARHQSDPGVLSEDGVTRRRRQPPVDLYNYVRYAIVTLAPDASAPRVEEEAERRDFVERILSLVSDRYAEILRYYYIEQLTIPECAERMGVTEKAAKGRLARAIARCRELAEDGEI